MLAKLVGLSLIIIGIAGLILPVIPGMLLIMVGGLFFFKDKEYEIIKIINEKAPPIFVSFYHDFLSRIINNGQHIGVDWVWVNNELRKRERMNPDDNSERGTAISKSLEGSLAKARTLLKPNYVRSVKKITGSGVDFIELEDGARFSSGKISGYIKGASHVVIFLVTIGEGIEREAGILTKEKDPLEGYLLDRIGSFAVESLAESVEKKIRRDYSILKKSVSRRYSPGYCDWRIEEQRILSKELDFSKIGVTLNESCMMQPKKSISAIVAIANKGVFNESGSTCGICDRKDCSYRRDP
ncbi:MAG: vitamin B12 dependent-methionine synthase activation domain-containing protein [Candidatus Omnitrophota bacterium]|nr:vitamin B12 dependent-methionine synthase activation domain-containing protein [Candidatus Omnitrophota bacterium]